jgi:hypothetical protein
MNNKVKIRSNVERCLLENDMPIVFEILYCTNVTISTVSSNSFAASRIFCTTDSSIKILFDPLDYKQRTR